MLGWYTAAIRVDLSVLYCGRRGSVHVYLRNTTIPLPACYEGTRYTRTLFNTRDYEGKR